MVAGKVKVAMGLQKSHPNPNPKQTKSSPKPPLPSPSSDKDKDKFPQKGAVFSRSFGGYFPRSSAQVQPRPPDVAELLHLVEQLRESESRLKTELLEQKLLKESVSILPVLENEISVKNSKIQRSEKKIELLETENESLRQEVEMLHTRLSQEKIVNEHRVNAMAVEISELKIKLAEREGESRYQGLIDVAGKSNLIKSLKRSATLMNFNFNNEISANKIEVQGKKEEVTETERPTHSRCNSEEIAETSGSIIAVRSRVPRVPKPPPRPSSASSPPPNSSLVNFEPPQPCKAAPPPPPPPAKGLKTGQAKVRRVPEVVEFYHSLMRRESRRDSTCGGASDAPPATNARDMIGEIENRSTHLLAIKTDVETQGDFIRSLIKEVESAAFTDIEDVVPFVKWLDDELSYLVDERAVLKHFEWPEQKADTLREAAFGYSDLKKLVTEATSFRDDCRQPCVPALKKMQALFEKLEHGVYNLSRMRESATKRYKVFQIPMDWMLDAGYVSQIKLVSVKLAMKYMKRVSAELEMVGGGPEEEELIVQGVKFAFRVHQFAGGFDGETMRAFQELRDKARSCHIQFQQNQQQQQKFVCRSTAC
ncbi:hypothetical protein LguiB_034023 [Lonicera macranthoides]